MPLAIYYSLGILYGIVNGQGQLIIAVSGNDFSRYKGVKGHTADCAAYSAKCH